MTDGLQRETQSMSRRTSRFAVMSRGPHHQDTSRAGRQTANRCAPCQHVRLTWRSEPRQARGLSSPTSDASLKQAGFPCPTFWSSTPPAPKPGSRCVRMASSPSSISSAPASRASWGTFTKGECCACSPECRPHSSTSRKRKQASSTSPTSTTSTMTSPHLATRTPMSGLLPHATRSRTAAALTSRTSSRKVRRSSSRSPRSPWEPRARA